MTDGAGPPKEIYCTFAGSIDIATVGRFFERLTAASLQEVTKVHLLLQSPGGIVTDGLCLYNLFRTAPMDVAVYNTGHVGSIAAVAYLGCGARVATKSSSFMIHRTHWTTAAATANTLASGTKMLAINDRTTTDVLKEHLKLSPEQWAEHERGDLWLDAEEALACKLCTLIGDFAPPRGAPVFFI